MHPTTITDFVKPDIVFLLFVDVASLLKLATLESRYSTDVAVTVTSTAMVNSTSFDIF